MRKCLLISFLASMACVAFGNVSRHSDGFTSPGVDVNVGFQGAGGLESIYLTGHLSAVGTVQDYFGNIIGAISSGVVIWNPARFSGYGPVPGYQSPALSLNVTLEQALGWRGKRVDETGLVYDGKRYYDPPAGRFIGTDPMGHSGSLDLYSFCGGDPNNHFDADGRFGKKALAVAGDVGMSLVSVVFTPQPNVPPELLQPWERQYYNGLSQNAQNSIGHPFQDAGFYEPNSGAAVTRELVTAGVEIWALERAGRAGISVPITVPEPVFGNTPAPQLLPGEGMVGSYDALIQAGSRGDNLTPHHMPAAAYMEAQGVSYGEGIAMNMEQPTPGVGGRHRMTASYGAQLDLSLTFRQTLAASIMDARQVYMSQGLYTPDIRQSLQQVIEQNLNTFPGLFGRNAPVLNLPQPGGQP